MSVHYSSAVWKAAIKDPVAKLVLLKFADNANDSGKCWPSIANISRETGLCRRTVQTKIRALEDLDLLKSVRGVNRCDYTLSMEKLTQIRHSGGVQEMHPAGDAPCSTCTGGVQEMHGGGAGDALAYKEPSLNRQRTIKEPASFPYSSTEFIEAWQDWIQHRKEIKKPITETSTKLSFKKLANMTESEAITAIQHSISNGYQGIYPPQQNTTTNRPTHEKFNPKPKRNGLRPFD